MAKARGGNGGGGRTWGDDEVPANDRPAQLTLDQVRVQREVAAREVALDFRASLGDVPAGFGPEEWRVVLRWLAPESSSTPGSLRWKRERVQVALECFPGESTPAAVGKMDAVLRRPHVVEFVSRFRCAELAATAERRAFLREKAEVIVCTPVDPDRLDPKQLAALQMAQVAAMRFLADLDGLWHDSKPVDPAALGGGQPRDAGDDPSESLRKKLETVASGLPPRPGVAVGTIDTTATEVLPASHVSDRQGGP